MVKGPRKIRGCILGIWTGSRCRERLLGSRPKGRRPREDWYADCLYISYHFEFLTTRRHRGETEIGFAPFEVTISIIELLNSCTTVDMQHCFPIYNCHRDGSFSVSCSGLINRHSNPTQISARQIARLECSTS